MFINVNYIGHSSTGVYKCELIEYCSPDVYKCELIKYCSPGVYKCEVFKYCSPGVSKCELYWAQQMHFDTFYFSVYSGMLGENILFDRVCGEVFIYLLIYCE